MLNLTPNELLRVAAALAYTIVKLGPEAHAELALGKVEAEIKRIADEQGAEVFDTARVLPA